MMAILVVDDHPMVREGMAALLLASDLHQEVVQASDATEGLRLVRERPDLVLVMLDLSMPGLSGMQAIDAVREARPDLHIVIVSASESSEAARDALDHGARGYVPKSSRPQTIVAAVKLVLAGEVFVPTLVLGHEGQQVAAGLSMPGSRLTPRQIEILDALSAGQSNKAIASKFGLSDKTVKAHVSAIFRTMNVVNRTQAAAKRAKLLA